MVDKIRKYIDITTVKFLIVGVINTMVGTGVMFVFYNVFSLSYWISSASNYVVGSIVSYFLNKYFTFQSKEKSWKQISKFVLNITVCYLLAYGMAKPLVSFVLSGFDEKIQGNVSMLFGMGFFVVLNYLGQRLFVFKKTQDVSPV
ncbi:GtrA family protein [Mediterraneibacter agrestimuris]|uniref:GtrA family protein n=1 Tax=Mediterraneibacter agrestimuris TaxID=2941333 RepID=UPI00203A64AD|nr:GtrA family protein [Mediterraneibacter agrestimuris]